KRYIQFIKSEPQPSAQSPSLPVITESVTPELLTKMQSTRSEDKVSPTIMGADFFGQTGSSFDGMPKVKRYIQFTQAEPYSSSQSQSPNEKMTKKEWKTLSSSTDNEAKSSTKDTYFDGVSLDNIPKVKKALQFTQSENQNITAANDKSSNAANLFGSLDLSFNQLPKVKRNVHIVQSEPYRSSLVPSKFLHRSNLESEQSFPSEDEFKLTTKENDSFGQRDGVPRLNRYIQFRQSEPQTQTLSPSLSSQMWESVDVGTESRMLNQLPKPRRSPFSSNPDAYGQPDQVFMQVEEVFRQTSSNPSSDNKKYANTQGSSSRTALSTTEPETILESYLRASSNDRQTRKRLVMDPALQDASQSITETPAASSEKDDAREYLRDSSLARQRHERRRLLFQQKRRAMDGFSLTSESFTSQETNQ
ncbi:hypothetical protein PDJAM_G00095130, partial [Pangasius djambal]|nr:hypothetical protein [Pangasius djambal]